MYCRFIFEYLIVAQLVKKSVMASKLKAGSAQLENSRRPKTYKKQAP